MGHIVVLSGSPRKGGNTDLLVQAFVQGAQQRHSVEVVSVADYHVVPCLGCNQCFARADKFCVQQDDMARIMVKLQQADLMVVASPVYFYGVSAQLKAIIDRLHTPLRDQFPIKRLALMLVGAASLPELFDAILAQYHLVLNFFHLQDVGTVLVRGAKNPGDVAHGSALQEAYELGLSV